MDGQKFGYSIHLSDLRSFQILARLFRFDRRQSPRQSILNRELINFDGYEGLIRITNGARV